MQFLLKAFKQLYHPGQNAEMAAAAAKNQAAATALAAAETAEKSSFTSGIAGLFGMSQVVLNDMVVN